jgi:hypothetical protein
MVDATTSDHADETEVTMTRSDFQRVNVIVVLLDRARAGRATVDAALVVDALQLRETLKESLSLVDGLLTEYDPGLGYDPRRVDLDARAESLRVAIHRLERVLSGLADHPDLRGAFPLPPAGGVAG